MKRYVKADTEDKKYFNVELEKDEAEEFKVWLKQNDIYYEASGADNLIHFEVLLSPNEINKVDSYLNRFE